MVMVWLYERDYRHVHTATKIIAIHVPAMTMDAMIDSLRGSPSDTLFI